MSTDVRHARFTVTIITLLSLAAIGLVAVAASSRHAEHRATEIEYVKNLAKVFLANHTAIPDGIGVYDINEIGVVCGSRVATTADTTAGIRNLNGADECIATISYTETFMMGGTVCIEEDFDTKTYMVPSEGQACPTATGTKSRHELTVQPLETLSQRATLTFVRVDGMWKYFPHAIVVNPSSPQRQYIAYRTN